MLLKDLTPVEKGNSAGEARLSFDRSALHPSSAVPKRPSAGDLHYLQRVCWSHLHYLHPSDAS